tara:strand:+ start:455 stop:736 length:282 start_codon:yes stop_codon:yes gene_type:complete
MSDMMPDVDALMNTLKESITDPAKQELLQAIASDAVRLTTMALTNPAAAEAEVNHVKAQMANLGAAELSNVAMAWQEWASNAVSIIIKKAMPI